jgi:hypothetical protein
MLFSNEEKPRKLYSQQISLEQEKMDFGDHVIALVRSVDGLGFELGPTYDPATASIW